MSGGMGEWVGEGKGKGGVWGYEAYEVKNEKGKITLSFTSPQKDFLYIFMKSLLHRKRENGPLFPTHDEASSDLAVDVINTLQHEGEEEQDRTFATTTSSSFSF
jgi:hypothetical protein